MASRDQAQALIDRAALVDRLRALPAAMRDLPQWLLWRFEQVEGKAKLQKVPYYVNGAKRKGTQGDEADRSRLCTFDQALARLGGVLRFDGIGFAFLPGDGLIGIDIDGAIDADTGEVSDMCRLLIECCASYTELSPSGRGVHIIVAGETEKFKDDPIGLEIYARSQYFTCTGHRWQDTPPEVAPISAEVLDYMRGLVAESKELQAREKEAAAAVAAAAVAAQAPPAPSAPSPAPTAAAGPGQGGDDFKRINELALQRLDAWAPVLFPKAKHYASTGAWRVTSKALGRDMEEDLSMTPMGINDYGTDEGLTPIDVVVRWMPATPKDALHWLAARLAVTLTRPARRLALLPPAGEPEGRGEPPPPPTDDEAGPPVVDAKRLGGRQRRGGPPRSQGGEGITSRLLAHFALLYGTDLVWDGERRVTMAVKNLRLLFGAPLVNNWLAHPDRRLLYPEQLVFEPGVELPEGHVNLFDGLPTEPVVCEEADVGPMLELARHLCSKSARTDEGIEAVLDQVLCWLALPLQQPGIKMRFSVVFHGPQGTGKNLFFDAYRSIFGNYGRMVGQSELEDKFNGYLSAKLFIVANEVFTRAELFHGKNKLKAVITDEQIPIRGMHQEVRWESNHCNIAFLSNELMPLALEIGDRRHLVVYTPAAEDPDLYLRVADFLRNGGAARWMHYLQRYDTEGFNGHTKPLMTEAKETLIDLGLKPAERFAKEWLAGYLHLPLHPCSAEQLYRVFKRWAELNGERFPPPQAMFTETVKRFVLERREVDPVTQARLDPALAYKVIGLKHDTGPRKSVRCWLPRGTGAPDGMTEGEWAAGAIDAFEAQASRFGRSNQELEAS